MGNAPGLARRLSVILFRLPPSAFPLPLYPTNFSIRSNAASRFSMLVANDIRA